MIRYQQCGQCAAVWYFERAFCPRCGSTDPRTLEASGLGVVYATTVVHRAPMPELRDQLPYLITLVDANEGFRVMGRGELDVVIGERVRARPIELGGREFPFFAPCQR